MQSLNGNWRSFCFIVMRNVPVSVNSRVLLLLIFPQAKGRLHRWDFETEEEWATYNEQKEAMPKAAFQFGVKMQDGRKTRKQNKDQKLTNDLHKINQILTKKKMEKETNNDGANYDDEPRPGKKLRL